MNKHTPIRIRFDLTISNKTIGFERLNSELSDIAKQSDPAEVAANQKQHLLRILHAYSNGGRTFESASDFRTHEQAKQIAIVDFHFELTPSFHPNLTPPKAV